MLFVNLCILALFVSR